MTERGAGPNRYSHTPRSLFDRAIDRQDVKRAKLAGLVRDDRKRISDLEDMVALLRATLTEIHTRLFKK